MNDAPADRGPGPLFRRVEEVAGDSFDFAAHARRPRAVVVKGATDRWPALAGWSFETLAERCERSGRAVAGTFQNGLIEQGATRPKIVQPITPYLRDLHEQSTSATTARAFIDPATLTATPPGVPFALDWSRLDFAADKTYLQQWDIFGDMPELKADLPRREVWPRPRATWPYVFFGPANTLTGLHYDFSHNWFCQVRGTKEVLLFDRDQGAHLSPGKKYDWGSVLSDLDVSRLGEQPEARKRFERAQGTYVRLEAGDALCIPGRTWHAIVALTPSISVGMFGLTPREVVTRGIALSTQRLLHLAHLYQWGNCACHARPVRPQAG